MIDFSVVKCYLVVMARSPVVELRCLQARLEGLAEAGVICETDRVILGEVPGMIERAENIQRLYANEPRSKSDRKY